MTITAIETIYNGYRFRSRLEARVAVFLHKAHIPYEYEQEGFNLDGLRYLPDFWLSEHDCWLEVKGNEPNDEEREKAKRLVYQSRKMVAIWWGGINHIDSVNWLEVYRIGLHDLVEIDNDCFWVECPVCHKLAIANCWTIEDIPCKCLSNRHQTSRLLDAYTAARQARFEHGERP